MCTFVPISRSALAGELILWDLIECTERSHLFSERWWYESWGHKDLLSVKRGFH